MGESQPACIRHLRDYIAIPSVNPMRDALVPADVAGERRYAEHLHAALRRLGLDAVVIGSGDRASVIAEATVPGATDTVLIASHLDTVPIEGMEIDPFDPKIEGGKLYGRGSCDTKSGMAAAIAALERVLERGTLKRNVILVGEADEECDSVGVVDLLKHLGTRRPDWVLATEPTGMRLVTRHKGVARARIRAHGVACHASDPSLGKNAIVTIARTIVALQKLAAELGERRNPELGPPTLSVGVVGGGQAANVVPPDAWLMMDRRVLPGETRESIQKEIEALLAREGISDVEVERLSLEKPPLFTGDDHRAVQICQRSLDAIRLPVETVAGAFGTDAGVLADHGVPSVVLGPGGIAQAHTAREYVEIAQVEAATDFFTSLLERPD